MPDTYTARKRSTVISTAVTALVGSLWVAGAICASGGIAAAPSPREPLDRLRRQVEAYAESIPGQVGVAIKHLESGQEVFLGAQESFPMASTFKIAVLVEALAQVRDGKFRLDDEVELLPEHQHLGSGILPHFAAPGAKLTIRNLMELMMIISDNSATDILLEKVGVENINARLAGAGIRDMRIDRSCQQLILDYLGLPQEKFLHERREKILEADTRRSATDPELLLAHRRYYIDRQDTSTPAAMNQLLEQIFRGQILPREDGELALEIMKRCQTGRDRLPGLLPPGTVVAHKTGTVGTAVNDVGIIELPDDAGQIAVSVFTKDSRHDSPMYDHPQAERIIAHIARAAYDYFYFTAEASTGDDLSD